MIVLMQDNRICLQRLPRRLPAMLEEHTSMVATFAWWSRIFEWLPLTCQKTCPRGQHGPKIGSGRKKLMSMSNGQPISKRTFALYTPLCDIVQQRVEAMDTFGQMSTTGDGLMLLRAIKDITYNFQSQKYLLHSLHEAIYVKDLHAFPRENYYNTSLSGTIPEHDRCDPAQWWEHSQGQWS